MLYLENEGGHQAAMPGDDLPGGDALSFLALLLLVLQLRQEGLQSLGETLLGGQDVFQPGTHVGLLQRQTHLEHLQFVMQVEPNEGRKQPISITERSS